MLIYKVIGKIRIKLKNYLIKKNKRQRKIINNMINLITIKDLNKYKNNLKIIKVINKFYFKNNKNQNQNKKARKNLNRQRNRKNL